MGVHGVGPACWPLTSRQAAPARSQTVVTLVVGSLATCIRSLHAWNARDACEQAPQLQRSGPSFSAACGKWPALGAFWAMHCSFLLDCVFFLCCVNKRVVATVLERRLQEASSNTCYSCHCASMCLLRASKHSNSSLLPTENDGSW